MQINSIKKNDKHINQHILKLKNIHLSLRKDILQKTTIHTLLNKLNDLSFKHIEKNTLNNVTIIKLKSMHNQNTITSVINLLLNSNYIIHELNINNISNIIEFKIPQYL